MTLRIDIDRGVAIANAMGQKTEFGYMFDGPLNQVEFLLHEIGHAISLGVDTDPEQWLSKGALRHSRIDHAVGVAMGHPLIIATMEEAFVLAAESVFFARLDHPIDTDVLAETARIQGVSDEEMEDALSSAEATALADKILAWARAHGIVKEDG